ncbi:hypothetical protein TYRP_020966 [Tyrophagus putrescentiae]|nr:hypothetical protein TYRP_020966 [Tyrophagus putrescentiae]
MPAAPSLEQSVTSYLSSRHCRPTPEWIRAQIPSTEQQDHPRFNPDLLYQAWIKLNWAEEGFKAHSLPALPPQVRMESLVNLRPITLSGQYLVQVLQITNISRPRSKDLDDIPDDEEEEDDDGEEDFGKLFKKGAKGKGPAQKGSKGGKGKKGPPKRVTDQQRFSRFGARTLRLVLTDGHIRALAIEYMPIPVLTAEQHRHSKLLLTGPFEVRAGTFLLRPANVKVVYMAPVMMSGGPSRSLWNGNLPQQNGNVIHNGHNSHHLHNGDVGGGGGGENQPNNQPNQNQNNNNNQVDPNNFDDLLEEDWDDLDDLLV